MDAGHWQRVKAVFQAALDLPPTGRLAYVATACGEDAELRREVEALLEAEEASQEFLAGGAGDYVPEIAEGGAAAPGQRIGPYQVIREIGSGGMGTVYLAERVDEYRQQVALKVLLRGMDTRAVVARFRYERQILAGLRHPNIACLLDGGATAEGRPFFVMEYVEGAPVDQWCRQKAFSTAERVKLFLAVCAAVEYAHQNLVVHRDLKPGNILVTGDGVPKLLDFGIAKLLRPQTGAATALTMPGIRPMTPEYASPEQARGVAVGTASDVYSLGVVLYELLTGEMPYRFGDRSPTAVEKVVCEQEPRRPSEAAPAAHLGGDLDRILLKALEKDVSRRYASVEAFREDLRRHLEGLPVSARPATAFYRAGKFVRRNRGGVAAAALVVLSLVGGLFTTTWQKARAERRFNDVRNLANTFLFEFHDKIKDLTGATEAKKLVVAKALEYLDSLSREASGDTGLELELAEAYVRLGDAQGNPYVSNIGDPTAALASYDKALRTAGAVAARENSNERARRTQARASQQRGDVLMLLGKASLSVESERAAVRGFEALSRAHPNDGASGADLASALESLGDASGNPGLSNLEDRGAAAEAYRRSLEVWTAIAARDPANQRARRASAVLTMKLGDMEAGVERLDAARGLYSQALERAQQMDLANGENRRVESSIRLKLAYVLSYSDVRGALEQYQSSIVALQKLVAADERNSRARMDLAVALRQAGEVLETVPSMRQDAVNCYRMVLTHLDILEAGDPGSVRRRQMAAEISLRLGAMLAAANGAEARQLSMKGLGLARELAESPDAGVRQLSFYAEALLRVEPAGLKQPEAALVLARRAFDASGGKEPRYLDLVAEAHYQAGRPEEALKAGREALALAPADSALRSQIERHIARWGKR